MPNPNRYLDNAIPDLYRRQALDLLSFAYITGLKNGVPSISLPEAAKSFIKMFNVDEEFLTVNGILNTYHKVNKDLINAEKTRNKETG